MSVRGVHIDKKGLRFVSSFMCLLLCDFWFQLISRCCIAMLAADLLVVLERYFPQCESAADCPNTFLLVFSYIYPLGCLGTISSLVINKKNVDILLFILLEITR